MCTCYSLISSLVHPCYLPLFICSVALDLQAIRRSDPNYYALKDNGGVIVVGSYVSKSSKQLENLLHRMETEKLEIDVPQILEQFRTVRSSQQEVISTENDQLTTYFNTILQQSPQIAIIFQQYLSQIQEAIISRTRTISSVGVNSTTVSPGKHLVIYTSRTFVKESDLIDLKFISYFITQLIAKLSVKPSFVLAKGKLPSLPIQFIPNTYLKLSCDGFYRSFYPFPCA